MDQAMIKLVVFVCSSISSISSSNLELNCARDYFPPKIQEINNGYGYCYPSTGASNSKCFDECYDDNNTICFSSDIIEDAKNRAKHVFKFTEEKDLLLQKTGIINTGNEFERFGRISDPLNEEVTKKYASAGKIDLTLEFVGRAIEMQSGGLNKDDFRHFQYRSKLCPYNITDICEIGEELDCQAYQKYRSFNGICNNLNNKRMGSAFTPYHSLIQAQTDSKNVYFGSHNARATSLFLRTVIDQNEEEEADGEKPNLLFVFAFQTFYHDIGNLKKYQLPTGGNAPRCCAYDDTASLIPSLMNSHCYPIEVPPNDPFFNITKLCIEFVRAERVHDDCKLTKSRLVNSATTAIDGSFIYGSTINENQKTRDAITGKFKRSPLTGKRIFGDARNQQNASLYIIHDIFAAFHDQVIDYLGCDEYEKARKFVIAVIQKVFFDIFEIAVGKSLLEYHDLLQRTDCYDPSIPLVTLTEFAQSTGRYSHDYVPDEITFKYQNGTINNDDLSKIFGIRSIMNDEDGYALLYGMTETPMHLQGVSNKLQNEFFVGGGDLYSVDIQREKDAGVETYIKYLKYYRATCIEKFDDFVTYNIMTQEKVMLLEKAFLDVNLIPLSVGFRFECESHQGLLPPTVAQIAIDQMKRLKCGDRYFWTNGNNFSKKTQNSINMITMTELVCCYAADYIDSLPVNIFFTESPHNPAAKCVCRSIGNILKGNP